MVELLEDNLSGDARIVTVQGFEGALSSEATLVQLTVADSEGVWLTLEDVTLIWNRSALLRGAIEIEKLTADRINVARGPVTDDLPSPEATPFALPELPVSISLGELDIAELELGESILGEAFVATITGSASLADGEGEAALDIERVDGKLGRFALNGTYANADETLALALDLTEGPSGIVAGLLDLPGQPKLSLKLQGDGTLSDFAASLNLSTSGEDRLAGDLQLTKTAGQSRFDLDVGGNIAPLFAPEYQEFFGTDVRLAAEGAQTPEGGFDLASLELSGENLRLQGSAKISASGWPEQISLNGAISNADGSIVLLPMSGPKTYVDRVNLDIGYDRGISDDWTAEFTIAGFDRPGLLINQLSLDGGGKIIAGDGADIGVITAKLNYGATGIQLDDTAAKEALGDALSGQFELSYNEGRPIKVERLTLSGAGIELLADASIATGAEKYETTLTAVGSVAALDRFATVSGQPGLAGSANLNILSTLRPLDGFYDILLSGVAQDLALGIDQLDPLLRGTSNLSLQAQRDTAGTRLDDLRIASDEALVTASANVTSNGSNAEFDVSVREVGLVLDGVTGAAQLGGTVDQNEDGVVRFDLSGTGPAATATGRGTITPAETGQTVNADIAVNVSDLTRYAALADRPLAGTANLELSGVLLSDGLRFDVDVNGTTNNLKTGISQLDPLLSGTGRLSAEIARTGADRYRLKDLLLTTPAFKLTGNATGGIEGEADADFAILFNDAGTLAPSLNGPLNTTLTASRDAAGIATIDLDADGSGTEIALDATVTPRGSLYEIAGTLDAQANDLTPIGRIVDQPLSGALSADIAGSVLSDLSEFETSLDITTQNLAIGNRTIDPLLRGAGTLQAQAERTDAGIAVRNFNAETDAISINATIAADEGGTGDASFKARLNDVGLLTDELSGPVTATGTASRGANYWDVDVAATGPSGIGATVQGRIADGGRLDLDIDGRAPLGLANSVLEPRRLSGLLDIDLAVNGPPALSSLSGRLSTSGARLAAPTLAFALENIGGGVTLTSGRANVDVRGRANSGGNVAVTGPVTLTAPYDANLNILIDELALVDPALYRTTVTGGVRVSGPLAGGALISGSLDLGQTDVQVPSSGIGSLGDLPEVVHIGESAAVRRTLARAGVDENGQTDSAASAGSGPAYPLDLTINAPRRIFIRGRGLDAELGGKLTIGGSTNNPIPVGQFDLLRGRIDILQQRFNLTEGSVSLQGDFVPYIRLVSETETNTGTQVRIIVEGPADAPEVTFESTPELPQDEILSRLIFGRDVSAISPLQAVQLAAAVGTLAGNGSGGLGNSFREGTGLDDFDITTDEDGNAAVRAGKYLTENVYTDVTINAEGETEINLNLDITPEITAKGTVENDGETSIGIFFERDY